MISEVVVGDFGPRLEDVVFMPADGPCSSTKAVMAEAIRLPMTPVEAGSRTALRGVRHRPGGVPPPKRC
jgi:hypothetical protein